MWNNIRITQGIKSPQDLEKLLEAIDPNQPVIINFDPGVYYMWEFPLPKTSQYVEINGNGSKVYFQNNGFHVAPKDQREALNEGTNNRYIIHNFTLVNGGKYGVDIGASFNSQIENIHFSSQTEACIRLRFALMTKVSNVIMLPLYDGIQIYSGDWSRATPTNSQSNHTVLSQCRVYALRNSRYSYHIKQSSGIVLRDCISEGHDNEIAVKFEAKGNPVVKHFRIENFHLEHSPTHSGVYISANGATSNIIDGLYVSSTGIKTPIYSDRNSPVFIKNMGWWDSKWRVGSSHNAPRIMIDRCHYKLNYNSIVDDSGQSVYKSYINVTNPLPA